MANQWKQWIAEYIKKLLLFLYMIIDDLLLFAGLAFVSYAGFFIHEAVGWFLLGAAFIYVAFLIAGRKGG